MTRTRCGANGVILTTLLQVLCVSSESVDGTFHLLNYHGLGVGFDNDTKVLNTQRMLNQRFRWNGPFLVHVPTGHCVAPLKEGSVLLTLSAHCIGNNSYFRFEPQGRVIRHLKSGKCLRTAGNTMSSGEVVLLQGCQGNSSQFWQMPEALYVIRHFGGLCWVYLDVYDVIKLQKTHICDRFVFDDNWRLKHYRTGKCVHFYLGLLRLKPDCTTTESSFNTTAAAALRGLASGQCVRPWAGGAAPAPGTDLVLADCVDEDQFRFRLDLDKGIYQVSLLSESCDDATTCTAARSIIKVNGHDFSATTRGISVAIFDYKSGILEYSHSYDIFYYASHRVQLTTLLRSLVDDKLLMMAAKDKVNFDAGLATALRSLGVSPEFARTSPPTTRMSMVALIYTGNRRKEWERVIHFVGKGPSVLQANIFAFRDFEGTDECNEEMGLRTGHLPNTQFSAKSVYFNNKPAHGAQEARLNRFSTGWCAAGLPVTDFVQVDLASIKVVSGLAMQSHGHIKGHAAVTSFVVQHSSNGIDWSTYSDNATEFEFKGCSNLGDTVVRWFRRTEMRFIRIVPKTRTPGSVTHCIRLELFGCSPRSVHLHDELFTTELEVSKNVTGNLTFTGTAPLSGVVRIGISTAENNGTLATYMDQIDFGTALNGTVVHANGTFGGHATVERRVSTITPFHVAATTTFPVKESQYSSWGVFVAGEVIDNGKLDAKVWGMISYESNEKICLIGKEVLVKLPPRFEGHLAHAFAIQNETREAVHSNGDRVAFYLSLRHQLLRSKSTSNAYNVQVYVFYNPLLFTVLSFESRLRNEFSLPASRNTTRLGLIHFQTDNLWYRCNQQYKIEFTVKIFERIKMANLIDSQIVIDYSYLTKLPKLNGTAVYRTGQVLNLKCQVVADTKIVVPAGRLDVPYFSILYDDVNDTIFFCIRKHQFLHRNKPCCFFIDSQQPHFKYLPFIQSVVGINTENRHLFGVDAKGTGYVMLKGPFAEFSYVDDFVWTAIQSQPSVRKAMFGYSLGNLPASLSDQWKLPSAGSEKWAVIRSGILKKVETKWKRVVQF